jgi:hypothetical protein
MNIMNKTYEKRYDMARNKADKLHAQSVSLNLAYMRLRNKKSQNAQIKYSKAELCEAHAKFEKAKARYYAELGTKQLAKKGTKR